MEKTLVESIYTDPDQNTTPAIPNSLQNLPGFPFVAWTNQSAVYTNWNKWYFGVPLKETTYDKQENLRKTCFRLVGYFIG
jgi:hypothetical protein